MDAPAVETSSTRKEWSALQLIMEFMVNKGATLNPSANGHAYITEQILNALTIDVVGLLGDVNNDGKVNAVDARLILQYSVKLVNAEDLELGVADVNGDGAVNAVDARLVLQYSVKLIDKFPAEK